MNIQNKNKLENKALNFVENDGEGESGIDVRVSFCVVVGLNLVVPPGAVGTGWVGGFGAKQAPRRPKGVRGECVAPTLWEQECGYSRWLMGRSKLQTKVKQK